MGFSVIVYCINLAEATERRSFMLAQADKIGFKMEFIEAISGKSFNIEAVKNYDRKTRHKFGDDLRPNEIACTLSHMKAFETFLESSYDYVVILEDDVTVKEDFPEVIQALIEQRLPWDNVRLELGAKNLRTLKISKINLNYDLVVPMNATHATRGIMYSRTGARKALSSLKSFHLPIDTHLGETYHNSLKTVAISPSLAWEEKLESSIGQRTSTRDIHKGNQIKKFRLRAQKIKRSVFKRAYAFYTWIVVRRSFKKNYPFLKCPKSL